MAQTPLFGVKTPSGEISSAKPGIPAGLMLMTVTDGVGYSSDTVTLEFDDKDMAINPPRKGVTIEPFGGYAETGVRSFGRFVVDSVTRSGFPHKISVSAQAVDAKGKGKQRKAKGYPTADFSTVGSVADDIASETGLSISISGKLSGLANSGEFRGEEEALAFLQRVVQKFDGTVTVKDQKLIVVPRGEGNSASGTPMQVVTIKLENLLSYSMSDGDKVEHSDVEATVYDRNKNEVKVKKASTGMAGPPLRLREAFITEDVANEAAKAKVKQIKRQKKTAQFSVNGDPFILAEALIRVSGLPLDVNGTWRNKTVTHSFSASAAYTTQLDCETPT